jgi:hypothetical protein
VNCSRAVTGCAAAPVSEADPVVVAGVVVAVVVVVVVVVACEAVCAWRPLARPPRIQTTAELVQTSLVIVGFM